MAYQVLARKWRPRTFAEVVGQSAALRALSNALEQQRLHHAYLFTGTRGVGKTTLARIFAKCINCEQGISATPCGQCATCQEIDNGCYADLIEVDAASRSKVEETRELLDNVIYAPVRGRYKIYLIDEIHMLSGHSFNALLKTLEEPPEHVKFLFATTDPQRLPVTVVSRCLQFSLTPLTPELIAKQLAHIVTQEGAQAEPAALAEIAQAAAGSMRDALSLLDQLLAYAEGQLTHADVRAVLGIPLPEQVFQLLSAIAQRDASSLVQQVATLAQQVPDVTAVLIAIIDSLQQIALAQLVPESVDNNSPHRGAITELAQQLGVEDVQLFYEIALNGRRELPYAATLRGGLEMILLRMLAFYPEGKEWTGPTTDKVKVETPSISEIKKTEPRAQQATPSPVAEPQAILMAEPQAKLVAQPQMQVAEPKAIPMAQTQDPKETMPLASTNPSQPVQESIIVKAPLSAETWATVVNQLPITGMTRAFAQHCIFIYSDEEAVKFAIAPQHAALLNRQQQQRLQDALNEHYGTTQKLQILVQDLDTITPALQQEADLIKRQEQAHAALMADSRVQALVETFDASVVPNSAHTVNN